MSEKNTDNPKSESELDTIKSSIEDYSDLFSQYLLSQKSIYTFTPKIPIEKVSSTSTESTDSYRALFESFEMTKKLVERLQKDIDIFGSNLNELKDSCKNIEGRTTKLETAFLPKEEFTQKTEIIEKKIGSIKENVVDIEVSKVSGKIENLENRIPMIDGYFQAAKRLNNIVLFVILISPISLFLTVFSLLSYYQYDTDFFRSTNIIVALFGTSVLGYTWKLHTQIKGIESELESLRQKV